MPATGHPLSLLRAFAAGTFLLAAIVLQAVAAESVSSTSAKAWTFTQQYQFPQAQQAFARELKRGATTENREIRLGAAVAMLNHPALKSKDRRASLEELQLLWDSRGKSPDHVSLWAGYSLGRWSLNYDSPPDFDQANSWFKRIASAGDSHYVAQLARLKSAGLWLYAPLQSNPSPAIRVSEAQALSSQITDRGLRISYLLTLIDGMLLHQADHQEVLARLQEVWALKLPPSDPRALTLCQLGTLSAMVGNREQAIDYYGQFLREFPIDIRTQLVRDRLAELTGRSEGKQP